MGIFDFFKPSESNKCKVCGDIIQPEFKMCYSCKEKEKKKQKRLSKKQSLKSVVSNYEKHKEKNKRALKYYKEGNKKLDKKHYRGAITAFTKAIKLKPDFANAYEGRASAKFRIYGISESLADYSVSDKIKKSLTS